MFSFLRPALCLLAVTSFLSCHKEQCDPTSTAGTDLIGRWELTHTTGGFAGRTVPADPARKQELSFSANGQVTAWLNGAITCSSAYVLAPDTAYTTGSEQSFLRYSGTNCGSGNEYIGSISATELVLSEDYADGQEHHYARRGMQP